MFVAVYLPSESPQRQNSSIAGFRTEKCAEEYIFSKMCKSCKQEREAALRGEGNWGPDWGEEIPIEGGLSFKNTPSLHPGCACEWEVQDMSHYTPEELKEYFGYK